MQRLIYSPLIRKARDQVKLASRGSPSIKEFKDLHKFVIKGEKAIQGGKCRRIYECSLCGAATVNKGHLLAHIEGKHFPKVLKYTCNRCGRSQGNKASAWAHMKKCKVLAGTWNAEFDKKKVSFPKIYKLSFVQCRKFTAVLIPRFCAGGNAFIDQTNFILGAGEWGV